MFWTQTSLLLMNGIQFGCMDPNERLSREKILHRRTPSALHFVEDGQCHRTLSPNLGGIVRSLNCIIACGLLLCICGCSPSRSERIRNAIKSGSLSDVANIIRTYEDANYRVQIGSTHRYYTYPLHLSVASGNVPVIDYIIQIGADPNNTDCMSFNACFSLNGLPDNVDEDTVGAIIERLRTAGVDLNAAENKIQMTTLMEAASRGRVKVIRKLVEFGADTTLADINGKTALDYVEPKKFDSETLDEVRRILGQKN